MRRLLSSLVVLVGCTNAHGDDPAGDSGAIGSDSGSISGDTSDAAAAAGLKKHYGHYFATNYHDTPADAAMLCGKAGVTGIVWRQTWNQVEPKPGVYNFSSFDNVLSTLAASSNSSCRVWIFVEFKSFANSPFKNPCPAYLQAQHSAPNVYGNGAATCFMWEPVVSNAYIAMIKAAAAHLDGNPHVEGIMFEESSLSFNGSASQDVASGGTYTATAWRDALIKLIRAGATAFSHSRVIAFLNFMHGDQAVMDDVSAAISAVPHNQACFSGPDLLPDNTTLYTDSHSAYELLARHTGCRSNSAQNDSYGVSNFGLESIFHFAVSGNFGDFNQQAPRTSGVCVNSYLFWNHTEVASSTGLDWTDALPVIAAHPYGPGWYGQCANGGVAP